MGKRHQDSRRNDDAAWLHELAGQDAPTVAARWARVTAHWPGWKLVALARRMRALGLPVVVPARLVATLEQRRRHRERAHTWAALPNLLRMARETDPSAGDGTVGA